MSIISDLLNKYEAKKSLKFHRNNLDFDDDELLKVIAKAGINPREAYATDEIPVQNLVLTPSRVLPRIAVSSKGLPDVDGADLTYFKLPSAKVILVNYGPEQYLISDKKEIPELTKALG